MIYTLAKPIQIHHARQWVEVPEGARVELIRRADLPPRGPILRTLDRANEGPHGGGLSASAQLARLWRRGG
jgi:hypothetical protein